MRAAPQASDHNREYDGGFGALIIGPTFQADNPPMWTPMPILQHVLVTRNLATDASCSLDSEAGSLLRVSRAEFR